MRSDIGIVAMCAVLGAWAAKAGGGTVALLYGPPPCFRPHPSPPPPWTLT